MSLEKSYALDHLLEVLKSWDYELSDNLTEADVHLEHGKVHVKIGDQLPDGTVVGFVVSPATYVGDVDFIWCITYNYEKEGEYSAVKNIGCHNAK